MDINLKKIFSEMVNLELGMAFEEFLKHEKTGILEDGIIRNISEKLGENPIHIINTEHALLREIAQRWYNDK